MHYIGSLFGESFLDKRKRIESYGFIEKFIFEQHVDWSIPPNTLIVANKFLDRVSKLCDQEF